uniref:Uncharacterized protein n=1 Tax=Trichobilharzia regenti TaxID=157069 RepID=A0AA85J115_TRIRE|nr:unnamed protein product [Trichobilharzia regenti]
MKMSASLWDQIFQCMNQRRDLLNNGHHHQHGPFPPAATITATTSTTAGVVVAPPHPSCSSSQPVGYVHKIFDNKEKSINNFRN